MKASEVIIAVDPGIQGAFATMVDGRLAELVDMPTLTITVSNRQRRRVDAFTIGTELKALLNRHVGPVDRLHFLIEEVGVRPKEGAVGAFSFGRGVGALEGVAIGLGMPVRYVPPTTWSRALKLKKGKDANRLRAMELFPEFREQFGRVKDDGRADAALIAHWAHAELTSKGTL